MAALSSSVFYTAHSPTKRKSTGLAIGLFSGMSIAIFLDNTTYITTTNQFWSIIKDYILPTLGIIGVAIAGGESLLKTIFPHLRSHKVSKKDVIEGSQDFIDVNGFSILGIDQIMRIAIICQNFDFCDKLSHEPDLFHSNEIREYFEIYYLCVKFALNGYVRVEVKNDDLTNQHVVIDNRVDFVNYINKQFPTYIHDYNIWYGYATKDFITRYLSENTLKRAQPDTFFTRTVKYLRNAFIILLVFLMFTSQVLGPWMNGLPSLVSKLATWNTERKNEVRLVLTSAMKPYLIEDHDIRNYYALSMWGWVQNRGLYDGEQRNGHLYLPRETMLTQIEYLETIYSFYEGKDDFYFKLSNEIGAYYKGISDCNKALSYFQEVLNNSKSIERRDFAISNSAICYRNQDLPKAIMILQEAYDDNAYIQSRSVLGDIYYEQGKYDEVVKLLNPISDTIDPPTLSLLGESLYQEGNYANSIEILSKALSNDSLVSDDDHRIHSYLYLGAAYFETNKPFDSAENFFKAFSGQVCPYTPVLSTKEEEIYIPRYRSAIDSAVQKNSADYRTNLWNFVYYTYIKDSEKASMSLKAHINESPDYEQEFTKCILNMIKSK